ncbi:MAG: hypothetical protein KF745_08380 [Phycisphaeraceae bacterium]|nr:hypothetical protein [Phycisphaeraceae bacterium]
MRSTPVFIPAAPILAAPGKDSAIRRRTTRVLGLTAAVALMSIADLVITLTYLRSVGMSEGNPIARFIMEHGSSSLLIWWKLTSVSLACLILIYARKTRSAEIGAWICFAILGWLTLQWTTYIHEITTVTPALYTLTQAETARWVSLPN